LAIGEKRNVNRANNRLSAIGWGIGVYMRIPSEHLIDRPEGSAKVGPAVDSVLLWLRDLDAVGSIRQHDEGALGVGLGQSMDVTQGGADLLSCPATHRTTAVEHSDKERWPG
jgi:hypothetical protein